MSAERQPIHIYRPEELVPLEEEKPEHKCGLVVIHTDKPALHLPYALTAAGGVQHRGQLGAGVSMRTENGYLSHLGNGLLDEVFTSEVKAKLSVPTTETLVQMRYGTYGGYDKRNLQPSTATSRNGDVVKVIHNGQFTGVSEMRKNLQGDYPDDISDTYLFAEMIAQQEGDSDDEKVLKAIDKVTGAYCLGISLNNKTYLARDPNGFHPFVLGNVSVDGTPGLIAASETHAINKAGGKVIREVKRGEVLKIDDNGLSQLKKGEDGGGNFCIFEQDYFMRPESLFSSYENGDDGDFPERWKAIASFREKCGEVLAERIQIPNASFVVGMPDSGIAAGTGYAFGAGVRYRQVVVRDHFDKNGSKRLFQTDNEMAQIQGKVLGKLSFIPDSKIWKDAIVVNVDDSMVRGSVSRQITQAQRSLGAKEVHWIFAYMPVEFICFLGLSMRTQEELIAYRHKGNLRGIADEIEATSVNFIQPEEFLRAESMRRNIIIPDDPKDIFLANGKCGGCVTGRYPIDQNGRPYTMNQKKFPVLTPAD